MKGRPILGVISGFMFGLFLGPTLFMWGVIPLHSELMWILPLLGIVLGLVMAWWAPFGRKTSTASAEAMSGPSAPAGDDQADSG
jgi:hypothetical protein